MSDSSAAPALSPVNPFKGPKPLDVSDKIFGRDHEISALLRQLISDRIVLLHSPSGCGKSSLVEAGLRKRLPREFTVLPTIRLKKLLDDPTLRGEGLIEAALQGLEDKSSEQFRFVFFDQFEEVITAREISSQDRLNFFKQMGVALDDRRLWVIAAIRDDYVGGLQSYLRLLPTRLSSRFRLGPLAAKYAEEAMQGICSRSGVELPADTASELAARLAQGDEAEAKLVEPVHLQVVCRYLWDKCERKGVIGIEDLGGAEYGSVNDALGEYYAQCLSAVSQGERHTERALRAWFGAELIDKQQRSRVRVNPNEVPTLDEVDQLENQYLIRKDKVQEGDRSVMVELAHDRLVAPVINNNTQWVAKLRQPWIANAEKWALKPSGDLLVQGDELASALRWKKKNKILPHEETYLKACVSERNKRRLNLFLIVAALCAVGYAIWKNVDANKRIAEANTRVNYADQRVTYGDARVKYAEAQAKSSREKAEEAQRLFDQAQENLSAANHNLADANRRAETVRLKAEKDAEEARVDRDALQAKAEVLYRDANEAKSKAATALSSAQQSLRLADTATIAARKAEDEAARKSLGIEALGRSEDARTTHDLQPAIEALDLINRRPDMDPSVVKAALESAQSVLSRGLLVKTLAPRVFPQAIGAVGSQLRVVTNGGVLCYEVATAKECPSYLVNSVDPTTAALGGPNLFAALGGRDGTINVPAEGATRRIYRGSRHEIVSMDVSSSGKYLAASGALWSFTVWELRDKASHRILSRPGMSPWGWFEWFKIFAGASNHLVNAVALHDSPSKGEVRGGLLAIARQDGRVQVWPIPAHVLLRAPLLDFKSSEPAVSVAFSPNGRFLAAGGVNGLVRLWDLFEDSRPSLKSVQEMAVNVVCHRAVKAIAFSPGATGLMAVGCQDGNIHIYDLLGRTLGGILQPQSVLEGQLTDVRLLAFDPDRRILFSAGARPGVEVWRIPTVEALERRESVRLRLFEFAKIAGNTVTDAKSTSNTQIAKTLLQDLARDKPEELFWDGYRSGH